MNSNDMPTPLYDVANIAADGTNAVTKLLTEYTRAIELITFKNAAIEDLNHKLEELDQAFLGISATLAREEGKNDMLETKIALLLSSKGLLDFDIAKDTIGYRATPAIPGVNCNEEPEDTSHEGGFLRPYDDKPVSSEPNDLNTDTSSHQTGNIFGADE